ncbi:hypothetical protein N8H74_28495 [Pseudomonas sp. B2M1-30]|uniref:hypothetical protein n=1 Tax=Pseudomonas TaxID=286 RepID=UPI0021C60128|nr:MULTISPECIES: hypothetical protein [Pseudomonas]MCU0122212.1 hypothetical protein [Pseudomonas sp. B2M1-30]MCU7264465.1 hypothetical protein [Pseudomonas koreensis]
MLVKNITWTSPNDEEAEVDITDGYFTCKAFSYPCNAKIGDSLSEPLHIFSLKHAKPCNKNSNEGIRDTKSNGLSKKIIAKVVDITTQTINIGRISFIVDDHLPEGITNGDIIELECARVDLW